MPPMYVSMSARTALPSLPSASSACVCLATSASVCALGVKLLSWVTSPIALRPGAPIAATRAL